MDEIKLRLLKHSHRATTRAWVIYTALWLLVLVGSTYVGWHNSHPYTGLAIGAAILVICLGYAFLISPWHLMHKLPQPGPEFAPTAKHLEHLITPICEEAQIEVPRIFIVPTEVCNAFAAGVLGKTKAIGITVGALRSLSDEEITAVLAHEVSHIKRKDNLFTGFWIAFIGLTMVVSIVLFTIGAGLASNNNRRRRKEDDTAGLIGLAAMAVALVGGTVAIVLMHIAMRTDQRRREYLADHDAATWTQNPLALASSLEKMEAQPTALFTQQTAVAYAFSMRAVPKRGLIGWLFDTHPSTRKRIERLQKLAEEINTPIELRRQ